MINGKQKSTQIRTKSITVHHGFFILTGNELKLIIDSAFFTAN